MVPYEEFGGRKKKEVSEWCLFEKQWKEISDSIFNKHPEIDSAQKSQMKELFFAGGTVMHTIMDERQWKASGLVNKIEGLLDEINTLSKKETERN